MGTNAVLQSVYEEIRQCLLGWGHGNANADLSQAHSLHTLSRDEHQKLSLKENRKTGWSACWEEQVKARLRHPAGLSWNATFSGKVSLNSLTSGFQIIPSSDRLDYKLNKGRDHSSLVRGWHVTGSINVWFVEE